MKKVLLFTALSLCVSSAFAAETATLKVQGTLTNAACTPSLSNGGVVDFGKLKLGGMSATETNQLGNKEINLTITCGAATKVAFNVFDDHQDSVANLTILDAKPDGASVTGSLNMNGLGKTAKGVNIGAYSVVTLIDKVTVEGKAGTLLAYANTAGTPTADSSWSLSTSGLHTPDGARYHTVSSDGSLTPVAFTTATFPLKVAAAIQDTTKLAITDDTPLDGQSTINLFYL